MTLSILGLTLSYIAIAILLLVFLQFTSFHWFPKAIVITMVTVFYFVVYISYSELLGWPTGNRLPDHFKYHFSLIEEPSKTDLNSQGSIFLWVSKAGGGQSLTKPRAYRIPYSTETHKKLLVAQKKTQKGVEQLGEVVNGESSVNENRYTTQKNNITVNFYDIVGVKTHHK
jgi:hypothetical protein